jgi:ATP-dependent Zn protease
VRSDLLRVWCWIVALVADLTSERPAALPLPAPMPQEHPDTSETRAAVHEAGHALAAWFCTAVVEVVSVELLGDVQGESDGVVTYRWRQIDGDALWRALVVMLAGAAAEVATFGYLQSAGSRSDLVKARQVAEWICGTPEFALPRWARDTLGATPAFAQMFVEPLLPEVEAALSAAYRVARAVLVAHAAKHTALVSALLHRRRLGEAEVAHVLGHRVGIKLVGLFETKFVGLELQ